MSKPGKPIGVRYGLCSGGVTGRYVAGAFCGAAAVVVSQGLLSGFASAIAAQWTQTKRAPLDRAPFPQGTPHRLISLV